MELGFWGGVVRLGYTLFLGFSSGFDGLYVEFPDFWSFQVHVHFRVRVGGLQHCVLIVVWF